MTYNKLLKQMSVATDAGTERVSVEECKATQDIIIRFGRSYTLRAQRGEVAGLLEGLIKTVKKTDTPMSVTE
tara:strand:- start:696 stop:911 length:216 start_codon:yes stop_codon:yes gene_type:complete